MRISTLRPQRLRVHIHSYNLYIRPSTYSNLHRKVFSFKSNNKSYRNINNMSGCVATKDLSERWDNTCILSNQISTLQEQNIFSKGCSVRSAPGFHSHCYVWCTNPHKNDGTAASRKPLDDINSCVHGNLSKLTPPFNFTTLDFACPTRQNNSGSAAVGGKPVSVVGMMVLGVVLGMFV